MPEKNRCPWPGKDPLYLDYHDREWGVPLADDRRLFELLVLESAQAGLSWITILRRREGYRRAFDGFDPERIASYGPDRISALLCDTGIIRNRKKDRIGRVERPCLFGNPSAPFRPISGGSSTENPSSTNGRK